MNYKKILSMVLALSMLLSSFPISVLAVEETVQVPENNVQAEEPVIEQKTELQESTEALKVPEEALPKLQENIPTETTVNPEEGSAKSETATQTAVSPISDFSYTKTWDSSYQECIKITGYNGTGGEVVIPAEIDGLPVKIIGSGAFAGNATITSLTLPENIYKLEENAFSNCDYMTNLVVPSTLKEVYVGALGFGGLMGNNLDFLKPATGLEYLDISGRRYGDYSALGSFKSLKTFKLNRSGLTSNELQFVKDMTSLTTLELRGNIITDFNFVAGLTNLSILYLDNNQITDLTPLTALANLNELNIADNQVKSLKGLENCKGLNKLYASGNQITDFKALENMTYMFELDFSYNELTDLTDLAEGLKNISDPRLNLSNNQNISDLTPLKSCPQLYQVDVQNTQVIEEKAWEIVSVPAQIEEDYSRIGSMGYTVLSPTVIYGNNQYTSLGNTYRSDNETVVSFEDSRNANFKINGLGTANIIISRNGLEKRVPIVVHGMENPGKVGLPLQGLDNLNLKVNLLPNSFEELALSDSGVLWNYSGQKPEKIMEKVKDVTVNEGCYGYGQRETSRIYMIDQNDSLWIQDRNTDNKKAPLKVTDNVQKYVGNNAYNYCRKNEAWAWVLTKDGKVQRVNHDQTVTTDKISNVKDVQNLTSGIRTIGILVLTVDGKVFYRVDNESEYHELAQNVAQINDRNGFIDTQGNYHRVQAEEVDFEAHRYKISETILGQNIIKVFGNWRYSGEFYVKDDGSSWYKEGNQPEVKINDLEVAYLPISYFDGEHYCYLTNDHTLWCYNSKLGSSDKIDVDVIKTNLYPKNKYDPVSGTYKYNLGGNYLKRNGDLVDITTGRVEKNVKDVMEDTRTGDYFILYNDGRVVHKGVEILNHVVRMDVDSFDNADSINRNYGELVMIRTDGSIYKINPTQRWKLEKVGQCEMESLLIGDVDHDGKIVATDALMALRHSVHEITLSGNAYTCADVTFDQQVNSADALKILRFSVNEIKEFEKPPVK